MPEVLAYLRRGDGMLGRGCRGGKLIRPEIDFLKKKMYRVGSPTDFALHLIWPYASLAVHFQRDCWVAVTMYSCAGLCRNGASSRRLNSCVT
jgi:hypothetical protein